MVRKIAVLLSLSGLLAVPAFAQDAGTEMSGSSTTTTQTTTSSDDAGTARDQAEAGNPHSVHNRNRKHTGKATKEQVQAGETENPHSTDNRNRPKRSGAAKPAQDESTSGTPHNLDAGTH
jgi:hypothetical protein